MLPVIHDDNSGAKANVNATLATLIVAAILEPLAPTTGCEFLLHPDPN